MTHVVSVFRDRPEADAAARRLADAGIPAEHVHVQHRARTPVNETSVQVDELAAGGIFHDIGKLLDGLLGQRRPPEEAATYEDIVSRLRMQRYPVDQLVLTPQRVIQALKPESGRPPLIV